MTPLEIIAGVDRIAVRMHGGFYEESIQHGSLKIAIDPLYNPTKYIKTRAEIIGLPVKVSAEHDDFIQILRKTKFEWLYFDYKALDFFDEFLDENGNKIYFVPLDMVFCATIESTEKPVIQCCTGVTLCKPFYGFGFKEIVIPGVATMIARETSGIITDMNPKPDERIAYVESVGPVYKNYFPQKISAGDLVFRESHTNYEYEIAGQKLYVVRLENIDGVLTGDDFSYHVVDEVRNEYKNVVDMTGANKLAKEVMEDMNPIPKEQVFL